MLDIGGFANLVKIRLYLRPKLLTISSKLWLTFMYHLKRKLFWIQITSFGLFIVTVTLTLLQLLGNANPLTRFDEKKPLYNGEEKFDIELSGIDSIEKLIAYVDRLYSVQYANEGNAEFEKRYVNL